MATVCKTYRIYATSTASAASNVASVRVNIPGNGSGIIRVVNFQLAATGGAGVGFAPFELSKNNASQGNVNDAQNTVAHAVLSLGNATCTSASVVVPLACPVKDGDYLYLHTGTQQGTAPANAQQSIDIIIEQPGA